ncbi:MAG: phosphatase PAP2 family protein [candidate division KSB1 bacterium]|nr:phosphatase PAP2 family protein [candidate division KSB1 bacterium]MDZ7272849.1 phosphatase PAP2 family protein [candidate division KSB1 bacterium]MDZ7284128.1 phosphatase PAP2 family protein [candidate division KSB1 bacterium]MDZ7297474.1 phosphatase PAP2 family protein [candidate division KSB1 bacterium]MDZ7305610.1 phosphatase PAP2 family protein [candidate division KSB1 bacterium]
MLQAFVQNLSQREAWLCRRVVAWNGKRAVDRLMYVASRSGDGQFYAILGLVVGVTDHEMARRFLPAGLLAFALQVPLYLLVKRKVKRPRPFEQIPGLQHLIAPPDRFSFPSGHTAGAGLMATLISAYYPAGAMVSCLWAGVIAFSRVYNGVHYPTDVLAGALLGIACAQTGMALVG